MAETDGEPLGSQEALRAALDACLVTDAEWEPRAGLAAALDDPFKAWPPPEMLLQEARLNPKKPKP